MSSFSSTSSWMRLDAETGTIASHSRSSLTASSCWATAGREAASIFVTIATFRARGYCSSCSLMNRSPGPIFSSAGMQRPMTSTSPRVGADDAVESLAEQGARTVDAGGVHDDQLAGWRVDDAADGVARRLRLRRGDRDLLADEGVGESRLADVGTADEGGETGAVGLGGS